MNKIVLTFSAQQYGMTVEDLMERYSCKREDIIVEKESSEETLQLLEALKKGEKQ